MLQAAALFGDFSGWKEVWMTKDKWGVWEVALPDGAMGQLWLFVWS
jgi:1,4-alpha-glucan branching enzyme